MIRKILLLFALAGMASAKKPTFVPRNPAFLSVRGGAGPLDATAIAKASTVSNLMSGTTGVLAPGKIGEMYYGTRPMPKLEFFLERTFCSILSLGLQAYWLVFKESSLSAAVGVGAIPWAAHFCKSLLNGTPETLGVSAAGDVLNFVIATLVSYTCMSDASCADTAINLLGIWFIANGLFLAATPEQGCSVWGYKSLEKAEILQGRVIGFWLLAQGVYDILLSNDVDGLKALGYAWIPLLLLSLSINFITKEAKDLNLTKGPQYAWLLVEALVVATLAI